MRTKIDNVLAEFVAATIENDGIAPEEIQRLLDRVRDTYGLDVVYIWGKVSDDNLFDYRYISCEKPEIYGENGRLWLRDDEYKAMIRKYDENPVCSEEMVRLKTQAVDSETVLHYGFVRKKLNCFDGSVGFRAFAPRDWSDEEKDALRKLGNALKAFFSVEWAEGDEHLYQRLQRQEELQAAYEAANQANQAKTRFLANMSHDIRTPMNGIIGMTAIAGTHLDDRKRVEDCLSKIATASSHLQSLINEVLDMSKIESGKMELRSEAFELPEFIEHVLFLIKPQMEAKKHRLFVKVSDLRHERVIGDSWRLQQVFMNLLSNAVKYTPSGGTIRFSMTEKPSGRLDAACYECVFEDSGIGMSEDFLEHLFEPFVRADDRRVGQTQGTGLGMTITRTIVQMMDGDIFVESELNEGSRFTVTVTLQTQEDEAAVSHEEFKGLSVLVANDDEAVCEDIGRMLTELGFRSECVFSGREAVKRVSEKQQHGEGYYAVILDWKMSGMDGLEAARLIRRRVEGEFPAIILSAYSWTDVEPQAKEAGVDAFLSVPVFRSRLLQVFHEIVKPGHKQETAPVLEQFHGQNYRGKRALLVEDNELNAEIAGEILGMTGLTVEYAGNGRVALDMVIEGGEGYYDIIFMDIRMPVMNGHEAARAIRALPGHYTEKIPIVAMTANAFSEDAQAAKQAGMNEHIAKPIDLTQLLHALDLWLR